VYNNPVVRRDYYLNSKEKLMKKLLMWIGIIFVALGGLIGIALVVVYVKTESRLNRLYDVPRDRLTIPMDEAAIARGRRIFQFRGCLACHGDSLEGKVYLDDPALGKVAAGNLTRGEGGFGATFKDADWIAAIRYGIRPDGTPLLFMPSTEFYYLSDNDLADVIAFIKSVPPVEHVQLISSVSLTGRVIMALVPAASFMPAELIPLDAPRPVAPEPGIMSGGVIPAFPPNYPPAINLTWGDGSRLPAWEEEDFINFIRTGMSHGKQVDTKYMPWGSYQYMTDDELCAVWLYLQSLPRKVYGNR
jgi:mono/diheme cytochrome c family protein